MISFLKKPYAWAKIFSVILILALGFALLDAFVIPKNYASVENVATQKLSEVTPSENIESEISVESEITVETENNKAPVEIEEVEKEPEEEDLIVTPNQPVITKTSYSDDNIKINIEQVVKYNTIYYVADIVVSDPSYLKTALANDTYGRNVKATTSEMAAAHNAIFAINGDYYGFRDSGYVLRNGELYRNTGSGDALVIDYSGNFAIYEQSTITDDIILGAWQILSFGPALVKNSEVVVDASSEVSQSKNSNPRTAIGQISQNHYIVIVSDGRTNDSEGLSLLQLATELEERGATLAYNLDGGGSSTMVFNGELINTPTSGKSNSERGVSDIVYFGYE